MSTLASVSSVTASAFGSTAARDLQGLAATRAQDDKVGNPAARPAGADLVEAH